MHRSGWGRTLIAIIVGGVLASAVAVLPAVGQDSPPHPVVDIGTGRLVAKGAAVNVPVTYTCGPGEIDYAYIYVRLSQRVQQGQLAQGYGYTDQNHPPHGDRAGRGRHLLWRRSLQERCGLGHGHLGRPTRGLRHRGGDGAGGDPPARLTAPTVRGRESTASLGPAPGWPDSLNHAPRHPSTQVST